MLANKSFILNDFVTSHNLDILCLTETWLKSGDCCPLVELCLPNSNFLNALSTISCDGGIAVVYKNHLNCVPFIAGSFHSFSVLTFKIECDIPVCCMIIYGPPTSYTIFMNDFSTLLSSVVLKFDKIIIVGDFNIHIDDPSNSLATEFLNTAKSFNLV